MFAFRSIFSFCIAICLISINGCECHVGSLDNHRIVCFEKPIKKVKIASFGEKETRNIVIAFIGHKYQMAIFDNIYGFRIVDVETNETIKKIHNDGETVLAFSFSPDYRYIYAKSLERIEIYDLLTFKSELSIPIKSPDVIAVEGKQTYSFDVLRYDGRMRKLIMGGFDGITRMYDVKSGEETTKWKTCNNWISAISISDNGLVATGCIDGKIGVWNDKGEKMVTIEDTMGWPINIEFINNNTMLIVTDIKSQIYNIAGRRNADIVTRNKSITTAARSKPNLDMVVLGKEDGSVIIAKCSAGIVCYEARILKKAIEAIAISNDGKYIVASDRTGSIGILEVNMKEDRCGSRKCHPCTSQKLDPHRNVQE